MTQTHIFLESSTCDSSSNARAFGSRTCGLFVSTWSSKFSNRPLHFAPPLFLHRHKDTTGLPFLLNPSSPRPCATPQGGMLSGRLTEQSSLTGYDPKSLIQVSSERTPINLLSRRSFDASEITDTTEVGPLTSPLFVQKIDVSTNPFNVFGFRKQAVASGSQRQQSFSTVVNP